MSSHDPRWTLLRRGGVFVAHLSRTSTRFRGLSCKCVTSELSLVRSRHRPNLRFRRLGHFRRIMTLRFRRRGGSALAYFGLHCPRLLREGLVLSEASGVPSVLGGEQVLTGTCRKMTLRFRRRCGFSHAVLRFLERCVVKASALSLGAPRILAPRDPPLSVFGFETSRLPWKASSVTLDEVLVLIFHSSMLGNRPVDCATFNKTMIEARGGSRGPSDGLIPGSMTSRLLVLLRSFVRSNPFGFGRGDPILCRGRSSCVGDDLALPLEASPGGAFCVMTCINFLDLIQLFGTGRDSGMPLAARFTFGIVDALKHRHLVCKFSFLI